MKTNKGNNNQEEEEAYEEDFSSRKEGTSTNHKDGKNNDKANAIRSKHSVTEQRRRSKINERFQILRELIPHGDQKRDTASFLLEVIEYVQLLQERVQKHEGPCQGWSAEPTKLMPWRHSHWRVQSLLGHPQVVKNNCGLGTPFPGKLDEKSVSINPIVAANLQNPMEPAPSEDNFRVTDSESFEKAATSSSPFQIHTPTSVHNEAVPAYSTQRPVIDGLSSDSLVSSNSQQDEHIIEGGTISISSTYSHELLTTLTQALQNSGVDLSKASISIQIDLGKRANQSRVAGTSGIEEHSTPANCSLAMAHHTDGSADEDLDQAQKRLKT